MRIGIITGEFPPQQGGVGAYSDILSRHLAETGNQVFVFSDSRSQTQYAHIPVTTPITSWGLHAVPPIRRWIRENQIEIVNIQYQTAAYRMSPWIHFLPDLLPVPVLTTFHDLRFPYLFPKAGRLRDWIVMHLASRSSGVITTNYEDDMGVQHLRQRRVIPIGSNILTPLPEHYARQEWRQRINCPDQGYLLAYFGFINHSKGVDTLLYALSKLPPQFRLVMIGDRTGTADTTNEQQAQSIEQLISALNLEARIAWTGYVSEPEVAAYLSAADLVVLPFRDGASFRRGSLMAAIQYACPTITTYPAIPSALIQPDTMVLIEPDQPDQLVAAIAEVINQPERLAQLRHNMSLLRANFDWKQIAAETVAFMRTLLQHS
jgi:glycosyltransferase involved in cell wall biosynthesis